MVPQEKLLELWLEGGAWSLDDPLQMGPGGVDIH